MKSNLKKFAFVPVLLLVLAAPFAAAPQKMSCKGHMPTRNEVKSLIANAKTPEDHMRLACYFRAEAREQESRAKYHDEMAQLYAKSSNAKRDMIAHCKQFAEEARRAAEADNQLAAEHEQMAGQHGHEMNDMH